MRLTSYIQEQNTKGSRLEWCSPTQHLLGTVDSFNWCVVFPFFYEISGSVYRTTAVSVPTGPVEGVVVLAAVSQTWRPVDGKYPSEVRCAYDVQNARGCKNIPTPDADCKNNAYLRETTFCCGKTAQVRVELTQLNLLGRKRERSGRSGSGHYSFKISFPFFFLAKSKIKVQGFQHFTTPNCRHL